MKPVHQAVVHFIETFAKSLELQCTGFCKSSSCLQSILLILDTRCTVFMNSKVKQAQKEGAQVADISAGLAYSVIKECPFQRLSRYLMTSEDLGSNIVVQGGTFYNDAVLRSFEKISQDAKPSVLISQVSWARSVQPLLQGNITRMVKMRVKLC